MNTKLFGFLLMLSAVLLLTSCQEDSGINQDSEKNLKRDYFNYRGLNHNGKWFIVNNQRNADIILEDLRKKEIRDPRLEPEERYFDDNYVLHLFEKKYNHKSLRVRKDIQIYHLLNRGVEPEQAQNKIYDSGLEEEERSLFNDDGIVQIEKSIYHVDDKGVMVRIDNMNLKALDHLILNGPLNTALLFDDASIVDYNGPRGINPPSLRDCSAAFTTTDQQNLVLNATWNEAVNLSEYPDAELTWTWGDGSTTLVTDLNPTSSHTYANEGEYEICLFVNAPAIPPSSMSVGEPECTVSHCETINVAQGPNSNLDIICNAVSNFASYGGNYLIADEPVVGNQYQRLVYPNFILNLGTDVTDWISNNTTDQDWEWVINGQSYNGFQVVVPVPCAGVYYGVLTVNICGNSEDIPFNFEVTTTGCFNGYSFPSWASRTYSGGSRRITMRLKTKSKYGTLNPFDKNKVVAEMKNWRKKSNGNWTGQKNDLRIETQGVVYRFDGNCSCMGTDPVDMSRSRSNKKCNSVSDDTPYDQSDAIFILNTDPNIWSATFFVGNDPIATIASDLGL